MPIPNPNDDGFLDLGSHDSFQGGMPHHTFARMRDEDPMAWCEYDAGRGFWSVTRHADILTLNRDFKTLSSAKGIRLEDQTEEEYLARRTFQETDPPDHTRVRALLAKAFSKKASLRLHHASKKWSTTFLRRPSRNRNLMRLPK